MKQYALNHFQLEVVVVGDQAPDLLSGALADPQLLLQRVQGAPANGRLRTRHGAHFRETEAKRGVHVARLVHRFWGSKPSVEMVHGGSRYVGEPGGGTLVLLSPRSLESLNLAHHGSEGLP